MRDVERDAKKMRERLDRRENYIAGAILASLTLYVIVRTF